MSIEYAEVHMNAESTTQRQTSRRELEHAELLERALARPGIREVMIVYNDWQEKDRGLENYR